MREATVWGDMLVWKQKCVILVDFFGCKGGVATRTRTRTYVVCCIVNEYNRHVQSI